MSRREGPFTGFQSSRDSDLNIDFELDDEDFVHSSPIPDVSELSHISQLSNQYQRRLHLRSKPLTVSFRDRCSSDDEDTKG